MPTYRLTKYGEVMCVFERELAGNRMTVTEREERGETARGGRENYQQEERGRTIFLLLYTGLF